MKKIPRKATGLLKSTCSRPPVLPMSAALHAVSESGWRVLDVGLVAYSLDAAFYAIKHRTFVFNKILIQLVAGCSWPEQCTHPAGKYSWKTEVMYLSLMVHKKKNEWENSLTVTLINNEMGKQSTGHGNYIPVHSNAHNTGDRGNFHALRNIQLRVTNDNE